MRGDLLKDVLRFNRALGKKTAAVDVRYSIDEMLLRAFADKASKQEIIKQAKAVITEDALTQLMQKLADLESDAQQFKQINQDLDKKLNTTPFGDVASNGKKVVTTKKPVKKSIEKAKENTNTHSWLKSVFPFLNDYANGIKQTMTKGLNEGSNS